MRPPSESFNPASVENALAEIRNILARAYLLNSVRIISDDELVIEDDDGNDWSVVIVAPGKTRYDSDED